MKSDVNLFVLKVGLTWLGLGGKLQWQGSSPGQEGSSNATGT